MKTETFEVQEYEININEVGDSFEYYITKDPAKMFAIKSAWFKTKHQAIEGAMCRVFELGMAESEENMPPNSAW